jgi:hypothetical protein
MAVVATAEVDSRDGIGVGGEEVTAVSVFWRWTWRGVERMGQKWEKRGGAMHGAGVAPGVRATAPLAHS